MFERFCEITGLMAEKFPVWWMQTQAPALIVAAALLVLAETVNDLGPMPGGAPLDPNAMGGADDE